MRPSASEAGSSVEESGAARLLNVSIDGVGLRLARRVEPGTLLAVGLANPAKGFARAVLVRVAHVTPEAADLGPIAAIKNGDVITIDIKKRRLDVALSPAEMKKRLRAVKPMNVMALGEYQEPRGSWFPSVLY